MEASTGQPLDTPAVTGPCFLRDLIRDIPDFPKPGIVFKDITPVLNHVDCFRFAVDALADQLSGRGVDAIVGIDARGFLFAAPVAYRLGISLVPVRKAGNLPAPINTTSYSLEYGDATLAMHTDALAAGARVAIIDDVLATGGTAAAAAELVAQSGAEVVAFGFLCELKFLEGHDAIGSIAAIHSLLSYE